MNLIKAGWAILMRNPWSKKIEPHLTAKGKQEILGFDLDIPVVVRQVGTKGLAETVEDGKKVIRPVK